VLKSLALWLTIFAVYLAFLTCAHYWDGVLFSLYIEKASAGEMNKSVLFHPNHLVYSAAGFVLYDMFSALHLRAMTWLQILNALCGASAAMLVRHLVLGMTRSGKIALTCTIVFAFGATWWKFSTDGGSYVPATFLVLLAVRAALSGKTVEASLFHIAALFFHELAIFAALPIFFTLAVRRRANAIVYAATTAICTLGVYAAVFQASAPHAQPNLISWVTSFSGEAKMTHSWAQLFMTYPVSYAKLFVGGKLSLVRDFFSVPVVLALLVAVLLIVAAAWCVRAPIHNSEEVLSVNRTVKVTLWLWVLPYAVFLVWWEPGNAFYKLLCWPAIVVLIGISIAEHSWTRQHVSALLALAAAIAAWNFGGFIYPHTKAASDPVYALALRLNRELPKNAKVFYKTFSPDDWYLAYFAPGRDWQAIPSGSLAAETSFCLETTALEDELTDRTGLQEKKTWALIDAKHHVQVSCFTGAADSGR
jgi:hypothetical protein